MLYANLFKSIGIPFINGFSFLLLFSNCFVFEQALSIHINILYEVDGLLMPRRKRAKYFEVKPPQDSLVELSCCQIPTYLSTNQMFFSRSARHSPHFPLLRAPPRALLIVVVV